MLLFLHGSAKLEFDTKDSAETAVATAAGCALIQRCKRLLQSGTVWFAAAELVRDGWVLCCNQLQRTTTSKARTHARCGCAVQVWGRSVDSSAHGR